MSTDAERLAAYRLAEQQVLQGQRVTLEDGSTLDRADLAFIARQIERLERKVGAAICRRRPIGVPL